MNVREAKSICADFLPTQRDDKVVCARLLDGGMCSLPNHFRCELRTVQDRREVTGPFVSVSRLGAYELCSRNFALRYVHRATPPKAAPWKLLGTTFAATRARIDSGLPWEPLEQGEMALEAFLKLKALLRVYPAFPQEKDMQHEVKIQLQRGGWTFMGYADAISPGAKRVIEWKYSADPDAYKSRLKICRQASVYLAGTPEATEFVLRVAHKTRHKTKKGETTDKFYERVLAEYTETPPFSEIIYQRSDFDIDQELDHLVEIAERMGQTRMSNKFPPNYNSCSDCDFEAYCMGHIHGIGCIDPNCSHADICQAVRRKS